MNRHLNAFEPYASLAHHEDQLTRAAMIVVRLVPLARDMLLRLLDAPSLAELPARTADMQTTEILSGGDVDTGDDAELDRLISVFLTPDIDPPTDLSGDVRDVSRGQRLDGVLRFEPELVVAIESKVYERRSAWQSVHVNLGGVRAREARTEHLAWSTLLGAWQRLVVWTPQTLKHPSRRLRGHRTLHRGGRLRGGGARGRSRHRQRRAVLRRPDPRRLAR